MVVLPIHDRAGNALVEFRLVAEEEPLPLVEKVPMPASLVVVAYADAVLMMFDSWRRQWELPGGMRESGESARQAAVRELREETGLDVADLTFAGVAEFRLAKPRRRESLAVYQVQLEAPPQLTVNEEALAFRWWPPSEPVDDDMSPLDAEIVRRVVRRETTRKRARPG